MNHNLNRILILTLKSITHLKIFKSYKVMLIKFFCQTNKKFHDIEKFVILKCTFKSKSTKEYYFLLQNFH